MSSKLSKAEKQSTWGCGYLAPTPRIQYTAAGFSELWANLTGSIARCLVRKPQLQAMAPAASRFVYVPEETILERIIRPIFELTGVGFSFIRRLQHGQLHIYVLYIFITLLVLMLWVR
jgi:hydrogenase-4 component B